MIIYNKQVNKSNCFKLLRMQNNSLVQIKIKANQFIEDYQKQVTQRQYQKQKLKQNIMLEIMSNRHKSQTTQSNAYDLAGFQTFTQQNKLKRSTVVPNSENRSLNGLKNNNAEFIRSNSVPEVLKNELQSNEQLSQPLQCAQITFKMSKNRNNYIFQNRQQSKNQNIGQVQKEQNQQDLKQTQRERERQPKSRSTKSIQLIKQLNKGTQKPKNQNIQKSEKYSHKYKPRQPEIKPQSEESDDQNNFQQRQHEQQHKPIFLTLEQNQSLDISEQNKNKNYAFDIKMEKSEPIEDIQQLRRRKIQQMQKKRQQRHQQFKKQQQIKKINNQQKQSKKSNSFLKNSIRNQGSKISQDLQPQPPKSRSRKKTETQKQSKVNVSSQNIIQQSHYNMRPPQPQRTSYYQIQKDNLANEQIQTPKTINSQYRNDKSKGKNTIFKQSPKKPEKSTGKYSQEPKIEPKERKNTFVKQSNKKLLVTAITNVCLPGQINRKERQKLTQVIEKYQSQFFVLLFKEYSRKVVKGIYVLDPSQSYLQKIYGQKSPSQISSQSVQSFYRFDSGSREFKKLDGCKSFSYVVHAIDLA